MADKPEAEHISTAMDYKAHENTYRGFITLSKWTIAVLVVVLIVLYFIVNP